MLQGAKCKVTKLRLPYQVHYPGSFGSTGIDDLDYTLIVIIKVDALGCPTAPPPPPTNGMQH